MSEENPLGKEEIELRCEELGIEELFWNYIRLQVRIDDLEATLGRMIAAFEKAEKTREECLAEITELASGIPTIAVHREMAS